MKTGILLICLAISITTLAQTTTSDRPKLVVGIVVDQMRQEYLYRFESKFKDDGFKRLINDGFMLKNAHYNYVPTYTGPGHASVFTGTTPAIHGIIGNDYYDKQLGRFVNCVEDSMAKAVGIEKGVTIGYGVSPGRMLSTTITDELKLFTQRKAKVIGVSVKDRGAVLPAGHMADAAYWYDRSSGKFISSTYYMSKLPEWVNKFNMLRLADQFLTKEWKPLLPLEQYTESGSDASPYERKIVGKEKATFPYNLSVLQRSNDRYEQLLYTPFANDLLTEMAKATLANEKMGADETTDFLTISYSSTDILGHSVGPNAIELEDMYLRLDRNIADLLKTLDQQVGAGNYTVFLTADHAVAEVPQYLKDNKIRAGYYNEKYAKVKLDSFMNIYFPGRNVVANISNEQIFLNHKAFQRDPKSSGIDMFIVTELIGKYLMTFEGVANYFTEGVIRQGAYDEKGIKGMVIRGYHPKRSGDIAVVLEPGWFETLSLGTTHGSPYTYDTHVPVLFFGKGIKKGTSVQYHPITDVAPTLSVLLSIKFPSGCTGQPIVEIFE